MTLKDIRALVRSLEKTVAGDRGPFAKGYRRALAELLDLCKTYNNAEGAR